MIVDFLRREMQELESRLAPPTAEAICEAFRGLVVTVVASGDHGTIGIVRAYLDTLQGLLPTVPQIPKASPMPSVAKRVTVGEAPTLGDVRRKPRPAPPLPTEQPKPEDVDMVILHQTA